MAALYDGEPLRAERTRPRPGAHLRSIRAAGGERRPGRLDAAGDAKMSSRIQDKDMESLDVYLSVAFVQGGPAFGEPWQGARDVPGFVREFAQAGPVGQGASVHHPTRMQKFILDARWGISGMLDSDATRAYRGPVPGRRPRLRPGDRGRTPGERRRRRCPRGG